MTVRRQSTRRLTALQDRAIARALEGGQHQVLIGADGAVRILPSGVTDEQAIDAALDAEIRGLLDGDGHARH